MEFYPLDYVAQPAPLVVIQGLGKHTIIDNHHYQKTAAQANRKNKINKNNKSNKSRTVHRKRSARKFQDQLVQQQQQLQQQRENNDSKAENGIEGTQRTDEQLQQNNEGLEVPGVNDNGDANSDNDNSGPDDENEQQQYAEDEDEDEDEDDEQNNAEHPLLRHATSLVRKLPAVTAEFAKLLVSLFQHHDVDEDIWVSELTKTNFSAAGGDALVYKFKFVDNDEFKLPLGTGANSDNNSSTIKKSKSPLSPFNKDSQVYPQGILDEKWLSKYRELVPAVFISIHQLNTNDQLSEADYLQSDKVLALEITSMKTQLQNAGIKFIEIIVAEKPQASSGASAGPAAAAAAAAAAAEAAAEAAFADRINNIRTMTGLAPRTGLLFLPAGTAKDYNIFVEAVLHLIKPWCYDYYINLEKKLRRKRVNPPQQITKEIILASDNSTIRGYSMDQWDARYAVKLALINLFHQNNEMSIKHLESAYESLTILARAIPLLQVSNNKNAVFLWHQTRQLLDVLTISIVREYLYLELPNKAYRRFDNHIQNVVSLLKGKNINPASYAVSTWLSIQFEWLGELCVTADEYIVPIDKALLTDYHFGALAMPQPGYIFLQAVSFLRRAKTKTESVAKRKNIQVPRKERLIFSESDAEFFIESVEVPNNVLAVESLDEKDKAQGQVGQVLGEIVDYYLCLPVERNVQYPFHQKMIVLLQKALMSFMKAKETEFERSISYINFQLAEESYSLGNYEKAVAFYEDCLNYYKLENWKSVVVVILVKLINCFIKLRKWNGAILYGLDLAIIDEVFIPTELRKLVSDTQFSLTKFIKFDKESSKPTINLYPADDAALPPNIFTGMFLFKKPLLPLSYNCEMQFSLQSLLTGVLFESMVIDTITIEFNGYFLPVVLKHDPSKPSSTVVDIPFEDFEKQEIEIQLQQQKPEEGKTQDKGAKADYDNKREALVAYCNSEFSAKEFKVFHFSQMASKIDTNTVSSIVLTINHEKFNLKLHMPVSAVQSDDLFLDASNNSARVTPHNTDVNVNYFVNKMPKDKFFWVTNAKPEKSNREIKLLKQLISTTNPYETVVIPRRPKTEIIVENPTNAFSNEVYELKLEVDNQDGEDIGLIFRPLVRVFDNSSAKHGHGTTRPSSRVSSQVTSPRNSLDLRDFAGAAVPGAGANAGLGGTNGSGVGGSVNSISGGGLPLFNLQWDGSEELEKLKENEVLGDTSNLDLKLTEVKAHSKRLHSLFIRAPNVVNKYFVIKIECSFFTGDNIAKQQESEEKTKSLSTRDTLNIRIPIVSPFLFSFGVLPTIRFEDLPNAFVFDAVNKYNNKAYTGHTRTWTGKSAVKYLGTVPIEILQTNVEIYTPNPNGFLCDKLSSNDVKDSSPKQLDASGKYSLEELFVTSKDSILSQANIPIHVKIAVKWARQHKGETKQVENYTESQIWKLTLPLFEPRVLFEVARSETSSTKNYGVATSAPIAIAAEGKGDEELEHSFNTVSSEGEQNDQDKKNKYCTLKYVIENPTPRVFTFSTAIESNENFELVGHNKNVAQLPVLPFTRQQLKFKAIPKASGKLKIPTLRVYDLLYKVTLPILLATNEALADRTDIYIRV